MMMLLSLHRRVLIVTLHPKFSSDIKTDDLAWTHTHPQEGMKKFITQIIRFSGKASQAPKQVPKWIGSREDLGFHGGEVVGLG